MSQFTVVYDACVLYPAPLRSFLIYLAGMNLFRARWSNDIHEEWMRNVVKDYPDISRTKIQQVRCLMDAHVPDCLVNGYEPLIPNLSLPDLDDRHVLAAAIRCGADAIITFNIKDFPESELKQFGVEALHPDDFIISQLNLAPNEVCTAAKTQRMSLKNPPKSVEEFLDSLERQGLPQTVSEFRQFESLI